MSAALSPETKRTIENLMSHQIAEPSECSYKVVELDDSERSTGTEEIVDAAEGQSSDRAGYGAIFETDEDIEMYGYEHDSFSRKSRLMGHEDDLNDSMSTVSLSRPRRIQISLHADSEFFNVLSTELSSIDDLQARQKDILTVQVKALGHDVQIVAEPSKSRHSDLYVWREIFSLYREASVFFGATERDRGPHTVEQARERVQWFSDQLVARRVVNHLFRASKAGLEIQEQEKRKSFEELSKSKQIPSSKSPVQGNELQSHPKDIKKVR